MLSILSIFAVIIPGEKYLRIIGSFVVDKDVAIVMVSVFAEDSETADHTLKKTTKKKTV